MPDLADLSSEPFIVFSKMWATEGFNKCSFNQVIMMRTQLKGMEERMGVENVETQSIHSSSRKYC